MTNQPTEQQMNEAIQEFAKKVMNSKIVVQGGSNKSQAELLCFVITAFTKALMQQVQEKEVK